MRWLILFAVLATAPAGATEVYRWVDAEGQAHYTDQWQPGAEKVRIEELPRVTARQSRARHRQRADDAGCWPVRVAGNREPRPGGGSLEHRRSTPRFAAGESRPAAGARPSPVPGWRAAGDTRRAARTTQLTDVVRGVHTLKAEVVNEKGRVLIASATTTFVVRQTSIANPQRPGDSAAPATP